jgi:N-acetylneuraminic acid mutarotase
MSTTGAPAGRYWHTAVWTGSEMIVWGGSGFGSSITLSDGGCYNPQADSWTAVSTNGVPAARIFHTAVWTGSEMVVWGGGDGGPGVFNDGGRYNPTGNSWTAMSITGAPAARALHTAVWTGTVMIVWGGAGSSYLNDTWSYTPGKVMYLYQRP